MTFLIWWTNQEECESVTDELLESLPDYVQSQYDSRYGRTGRGRLWVHPDFDDQNIEVNPWPDTVLAKKLAEDSGGIVFKAEDLNKMSRLPGDITNLQLEIQDPVQKIVQALTNEFGKDHHVVEINMEPTNRGFERGEFTDLYGHQCSIQDSSLATQPAIWLGVNDAAPQICVPGEGWKDVEFDPETLFHTRMHLSIDHAKALVVMLQRFIETGSIGE